jgi:hypothetical protein
MMSNIKGGACMDALYGNIGGKLKGWALGIFITESIAAVIVAFVLMASDLLLAGFLTLIAGPLVAWVSSWLLYAFGELVEKTTKNEQNTAKMVVLLESVRRAQSTQVAQEGEKPVQEAAKPTAEVLLTMEDCWFCKGCRTRNLRNRPRCWRCGKPYKE